MSVSAFVLNPVNEIEKSLSILIATKEFFSRVWVKGCEELKLEWIPIFSTGIDILRQDLIPIKIELEKLKKWSEKNLSKQDKEKIIDRINKLEINLPRMFNRKDAIVFIG